MPVQIRNTSRRWGAVAQLLHWLVVALIITQFALARIADHLPAGVAKLAALAQHKSVGITILGLAVLRLLWRLMNRPSPALPADLKPWERGLAHLTHHGLYLLLFALPLSGWMMSSAKNYPVSWFGVGRLPNLVAPDETLFAFLKGTHQVLATTLLVVAVLHALAALQHHFVRRDDVLRRMLPFTAAGTRHGAAKLALAAMLALLLAWGGFRLLRQPGAAAGGAVTTAAAADDTVVAPAPATAAPAGSAAWHSDAAASKLEFGFVQAGAATQGSFGNFNASIDFTPGAQPTGRFDVKIDVASVDTSDKERNEQLRTADLFDVMQFPQARYVATTFVTRDGGYQARGQLTLRGVTRDVPLDFTWTPAADGAAQLKGNANLKRLAFGVGQGEWKSTEWVGDDVQVSFTLALKPAAH